MPIYSRRPACDNGPRTVKIIAGSQCSSQRQEINFSIPGDTKVALTAVDTPVRGPMGVTGVTVIGIFWQYGKPAVLRASLVADYMVSPVENSFPFHDTV